MTSVSIFGIAIGIGALVVVLSVMGGLSKEIKEKMFLGLPHLEIFAQNKAAGFSLQDLSLDRVKDLSPKIKSVEPFVQSSVLIKKGKNVAYLTLFGIDPNLGGALWGFSQGMVEGEIQHLLAPNIPLEDDHEQPIPGIILGDALASTLNVGIGDEITILNPGMSALDILGQGNFSLPFRVVGVFITDLPNYDNKYGVVSISAGRQFMADYEPSMDDKEYVSGIGVNFYDPEEVTSFPMQHPSLSSMAIETWRTVNKALLFALELEKFAMGIILMLIVVVAAFSISGTMMMTVYHKKRSISILRSLGMSQRDCAGLFLLHGLGIGTIGVLFGLLGGFFLLSGIALMAYFQIALPPLFVDKPPPFAFLPLEYFLVCFFAWILSLAAALYPAMMAARQDPGIGLRSL